MSTLPTNENPENGIKNTKDTANLKRRSIIKAGWVAPAAILLASATLPRGAKAQSDTTFARFPTLFIKAS